MLSSLLLPMLRERFPGRGLVEGTSPDACAVFPGIHPGIRSVSIYDDIEELTVSVDELTHDHFCDYDYTLSKPERERRIVDSVVEFLDALFADHVAVWGQHNVGGGWSRIDVADSGGCSGVTEFLWSGTRASVEGK
jgi:hypothetical protein